MEKEPINERPNLPQFKALTDEQYDTFRSFKDKVVGWSLDKESSAWADDACILRYLRARSFNEDKAEKMMKATIEWRKEYKPHLTQRDEIAENLGTLYRNGKDREGRPIMWIKPGAYNPHSVDKKVRTMMYSIEEALESMDAGNGVEQMVLMLDFSEYGSRARSPDGRKVAQTCLSLLQDNYPERLGLAFFINHPWWVSLLFTILSPFIDSVTKSKMKFIKGSTEELHAILSNHIDDENLEKSFGGTREVGHKVEPDLLVTKLQHGQDSEKPKERKKKKQAEKADVTSKEDKEPTE